MDERTEKAIRFELDVFAGGIIPDNDKVRWFRSHEFQTHLYKQGIRVNLAPLFVLFDKWRLQKRTVMESGVALIRWGYRGK